MNISKSKLMKKDTFLVRYLGITKYEKTLKAMQSFTTLRSEHTQDEIWLLEHESIYTLGLAGDPRHLMDNEKKILVYKSDRGGQITYHAPGQLIIYTLLDLRRRQISIRSLIRALENVVIKLLRNYNIIGFGSYKNPGVYVDERKVASLGLRIKNGCCYHGISLNINMDLLPFKNINPCGISGMKVTQLSDLGVTDNKDLICQKLIDELSEVL